MGDNLRQKIFDRGAEIIDAHSQDGISAEGIYSESVHLQQRAFVKGVRAGILAAMNVAAPRHSTTPTEKTQL